MIHTKVEAECCEHSALRDDLQRERLNTIRFRGMATRTVWALQGLCNQAEAKGVDVSYWRDLAADVERRLP